MTNELERLKETLRDRYDLHRELGRGGMATVYLATDLRHNRPVALKIIKPELAAALGPARFLREIAVTARLEHPHILPLLDSGEADGNLYYVMPYVEGESLRDLLRRVKQIPLDDVLRITREVADALNYAHSHDVVHRDVKPENILLAGGHARVMDFGIARAVSTVSGETLTDTGLAIGTPTYMSPEQSAGDRSVDGRSDIWSLGCVAYEMLAGQPPYTGATSEAIQARKSLEPVPSLQVVRSSIPSGVEGAIVKALARVPADRFATPTQFAEALDRAALAPDPVSRARPAGLRRRLLIGAASVTVLTLGAWGVANRFASASPEIRSLVVLPFDNLSRDPAQQYFVEGMHDAVITELARLGPLRVISRTSAMHYRETGMSAPSIARELGVDALVEGAVQQVGNSVRISVRLIQGTGERQLWAETYQRDLQEVLALQSEIAGAVASEIAVALSPESRRRLQEATQTPRARSPDSSAYDAYLRGRYHLAQAPFAPTASERFQEAIDKDPTFAPAQAGLAEALWWGDSYFSPSTLDRARVAAQTAVSLDPTSPEAHVALGLVRMAEWDWQGSEAAFKEAIALSPSSSAAHQWYAQLLRQSSRLDEALLEAQRALDLDPFALVVRAMVGWVLYNQHRYDEALRQYDVVLQLDPEFGLAIYNQGLVYWVKGMGPEVIDAAERAKRVGWGVGAHADWLLSIGYALTGESSRAKALLSQLNVPVAMVAVAHHVLGDDEEALRLFERALAIRDPLLPIAISEPITDGLREHPRFRAIRAAMRLP